MNRSIWFSRWRSERAIWSVHCERAQERRSGLDLDCGGTKRRRYNTRRRLPSELNSSPPSSTSASTWILHLSKMKLSLSSISPEKYQVNGSSIARQSLRNELFSLQGSTIDIKRRLSSSRMGRFGTTLMERTHEGSWGIERSNDPSRRCSDWFVVVAHVSLSYLDNPQVKVRLEYSFPFSKSDVMCFDQRSH